jgi:hypothetical protein
MRSFTGLLSYLFCILVFCETTFGEAHINLVQVPTNVGTFSTPLPLKIQPRSFRGNKQIEIYLQDINWPENFATELDSGLNVKLAIICELTNNAGSKHELEQVNININYDLWTEIYRTDLGFSSLNFKSKQQLLELFAKLPITGIFNGKIQNGDQLNIIVLFNPIKDEKVEKIRNWISANSISIPIASAESKSRTPSYSPHGARFFYRLNRLEKVKESAEWSLQLQTKISLMDEEK